jgi:tRNA(fMet)-specific endonuclease VapC
MTGPVIFDTDTISQILRPIRKQNPLIALRALDYLTVHRRFSISAVTRFEIRRGYLQTRSVSALNRFDWFCEQKVEVFDVTESIFSIAADLWAFASQHGHSRGDADLLIAATALDLGRPLVTGNAKHYEWMPGLAVEHWP